MTHPLWPLFDLRLRTPDLELRVARESELPALCEAAGDIHDPAEMPFGVAWTDQPSPQFERGLMQWWARHIANFAPERWNLPLAVFADGKPVGVQDIGATDFAKLRTVSTGSWLTRSAQGRGFGKQMRAAVLHLAFEGLGADVATSEAHVDNASSIGVSRAVGYEDNGYGRNAPRGGPVDTVRFRMTRQRWEATRTVDVRIDGLEGCLEMFGTRSG